jgi:hypothetical protein
MHAGGFLFLARVLQHGHAAGMPIMLSEEYDVALAVFMRRGSGP